MRTRFILGPLVLFFSIAFPAFASTNNLSSDPTYATGPFQFYCAPYQNSFTESKHYLPTGTGPCVYSVPSTITGSKTISIYKGTVGNAILVSNDFLSSSATLVRQTNFSFGSPVQDQNYFAVIYDNGLTGFDAAFRTGGPLPAGAVQNQNYYILNWKWGSRPPSEFDPVVIIPDILNSWQTDSGTVIDPVFHIYQNLIDTFIHNGYVLNTTVYPFAYNWEQSTASTSAQLQILIQSIKTTCGCSRVDIVAHGMGGLIASNYIESATYGKDVDQLVMLGVPFTGIPSSYLAWEGGQISFGNPLPDGLAQAFLGQESAASGFSNIFSYIRSKPGSAFQDLLPVFTDYLTQGGNTIPYPSGYPSNAFLENLLTNFTSKMSSGGVQVNTVLADDFLNATMQGYEIMTSTQPPLWPEGQPDFTDITPGDNMVPRSSIENFLVPDQEFDNIGHRDLPTEAQNYAFSVLNGKNPATSTTNAYPVTSVLFVDLSSPTADLQIVDPLGRRLGKDFASSTLLSEIPGAFYSGFNVATEYAIIVNPLFGQYQVLGQGSGSGTFTINANDVGATGHVTGAGGTGNTGSGTLIGYDLNLSTTTSIITLTPIDTTPPTITITNPLANSTHFDTESILVGATITDNSTIAAASYAFDGVTIDPNQPLPLLGAPLGTSTIAVAATDIYGNIASTSITFILKSTDTSAPSITVSSPLANHTYLKTDSVPITVSFSDPSGVASSSYMFNGAPVNPALPLPLSTAASGPATFSVWAIDSFGNATTTNVKFTVASTSVSDKQPPVIVITNPVANKKYARSDNTQYIVATITDASPIANTRYYFNGKLVDVTKPLAFKKAALGTSTVKVVASDIYGNTGSSSVSFRITAGDDSCMDDITEAFDHKWIKDKKTFQKVFNDCKDLDRDRHDRDNAKDDDDHHNRDYHNDDRYNNNQHDIDRLRDEIDSYCDITDNGNGDGRDR